MTNPFKKFTCLSCGYLYDESMGDPEHNLPAGTRFDDVPSDWQCPLCGVGKGDFEPSDELSEASHHATDGVVIIGAGLAGWAVVEAVRALDKNVSITLISADSADRYHKPMLSVAMSQGKTRTDLVRTTGEQSAHDNAMTLMAHTTVININPDTKTLTTTQGDVAYDKLVLAMGANPIYPPTVPKDMAWHVNHLDALTDLQSHLSTPKNIAIIGAGMVGVELAEDLQKSSHQVSLIDISPYPLSALLPSVAGERILSALVGMGINWLGGSVVQSITKRDDGYELTILDDKGNTSTHNFDEIIVATGLLVDKTLPSQAGITMDKAGIVVDGRLQTSVPDIYALGDCISIGGVPCRYVAPHRPQATAIAHEILGISHAGYTHKPPMIRLKNKCISVTANGSPNGKGDWRIVSDSDGELSLDMIQDGEVVAKALIKG